MPWYLASALMATFPVGVIAIALLLNGGQSSNLLRRHARAIGRVGGLTVGLAVLLNWHSRGRFSFAVALASVVGSLCLTTFVVASLARTPPGEPSKGVTQGT